MGHRLMLKRAIETSKKKPQPLVFFAKGGTMGDLKPLAILAVIAARSSSTPVTFIHRENVSFRFIHKLVRFMIGEDFRKHLIISTIPPAKFKQAPSEETQTKLQEIELYYFSFGQLAANDSGFNYSLNLDFGDQGFSENRFVSTLLFKYKPNSTYFGSLYLPLNRMWSEQNVINKLQTFKTQQHGKKIMTIAGSLSLPFTYLELFNLLEKSDHLKFWSFILVGYNNISKIDEMGLASDLLMEKYFHHEQILIVQDYVEYEDLLYFTDFFVSNCGAGSVLSALSSGVPQTCDWLPNTVGADKKSNMKSIGVELKVGPEFDGGSGNAHAHLLMDDLSEHFGLYKQNAIKCSKVVEFETKAMLNNMSRFFELLSVDEAFQQRLVQTKKIPIQYSIQSKIALQKVSLDKRKLSALKTTSFFFFAKVVHHMS